MKTVDKECKRSNRKKVLRVAIKVPARVKNLDKALERLGGVSHLAHSIRKVHDKLTKA